MSSNQEKDFEEPVTITDKRRIDPETGSIREEENVVTSEGDEPSEVTVQNSEAEDKINELTNDLKRVHADYENYRKRTERDRQVTIDVAKSSVISELLAVLDDLDRANEHGDLENSPLKPIADRLVQTLNNQGLTKFGSVGDKFDPQLHEAVQTEGEGGEAVLGTVYRSGYSFKDRPIRTAMVVVSQTGATSESSEKSE